MSERVHIIGAGMVKFAKPGASEEYHVMASKAARAALDDAHLPYGTVQQVVAGYVYGDSTCGQRAIYDLGLTGAPVFNVNNNCSTGSGAIMLGRQAVEAGADCVSSSAWSAARIDLEAAARGSDPALRDFARAAVESACSKEGR